jgi:hypothetical protein
MPDQRISRSRLVERGVRTSEAWGHPPEDGGQPLGTRQVAAEMLPLNIASLRTGA